MDLDYQFCKTSMKCPTLSHTNIKNLVCQIEFTKVWEGKKDQKTIALIKEIYTKIHLETNTFLLKLLIIL